MLDDLDARVAALARAVSIAQEASDLVLAGYRAADKGIQKKGAIDLVTRFDLASEALIRKRLGESFPDHTIVGEEGEKEDSDLVWFVDPLDGTTNFAHGHPFFSVSIALVRGATPLVGVVAAPVLGVVWSAALGGGTRRNGQPCRVSSTLELGDALVATGFPYDRTTRDDNVPEAAAFLAHTRGIRRCGSAAMDLAMVADGTYDLYWEQRLNPWDLAAGTLLVTEAGGRVTDYDGSPADPRRGRLVASNGHLHQPSLDLLADARRKQS